MNEHFTILLKENESTNLKLLTEKLNDGFFVTDTITVGRSTVITMRRHSRNNTLTIGSQEMSTRDESAYGDSTIPF